MQQQNRGGPPGTALNPGDTHRGATTKAALTPARRLLVELMQEVNYGRIEQLEVRDSRACCSSRRPEWCGKSCSGRTTDRTPAELLKVSRSRRR